MEKELLYVADQEIGFLHRREMAAPIEFRPVYDVVRALGEAADGEEAVAEASRLTPDVILMDLVMPKLDGVGAMRQIRESVPTARVVVLTSFLEDERVLPAIQAGAAGYLLKNTEPAELARALRAAHAGEAIIDPTVAARLVSALTNDRPAGRDPADQLTRRER